MADTKMKMVLLLSILGLPDCLSVLPITIELVKVKARSVGQTEKTEYTIITDG